MARPVRRLGTSVFRDHMGENSPFPLPGEGKGPWEPGGVFLAPLKRRKNLQPNHSKSTSPALPNL